MDAPWVDAVVSYPGRPNSNNDPHGLAPWVNAVVGYRAVRFPTKTRAGLQTVYLKAPPGSSRWHRGLKTAPPVL